MKKIICFLIFVLSVGLCFAHNLVIRNNTNEKLKVSIWLSGVSFYLEPGKEIEFEVRDSVNFDCKFGVAYVDSVDDTTLELNSNCFYVGENKLYYWNEGY